VQEHRVEHLTRRGVEAEGDVGQAQRRLHLRVLTLELTDRRDGLDAVATHLLLTGGDGEGEAVDDDVGFLHPPVLGQVGDQPVSDPHLPLGGASLTFLVDGQRHHRSAVLGHQRHGADEAGVRSVAVLVVHRVDGAPATEVLQPGPQHLRLGGVEHDRQGRRRRQFGGEFGHVGDAVATHVVDAQVEHVRAVPGLFPRDLQARLGVTGEHGVPEGPGAVGIGALPDHHDRGVLLERHRGVQRGDAGFLAHLAGGALGRRDGGHHLADVLRGGAAAAAHQADAVLADEPRERGGQRLGGKRVLRPVRAELGQAGVGHHRHRQAGVLGQVAQVLAHLGGAGGAVQADDVDAERLQRGQGGADLAAEQHGAGGLHGDVADDRDYPAEFGHRPLGADHGCLDLEQVLAGFDEDRVGSCLDHPERGLLVGVAQVGVGGMTQGGQLGARAHRTEHEPG